MVKPMSSSTPFIRRGSIFGLLVAGAGTALATALIFANTEETISQAKAPLPVATATYSREASYQRSANFVGVVRAGSDSAVGFEVAGTVRAMPARVGTRVAAGDVLASLDTDRREAQQRAVQAELRRLEADLELARLRRERLADLRADGLAAQQSYDEARLGEQALLAAREATRANLDGARLELEKSQLLAPFDGVVAARLVQEGAVVNAGTPVLRLVAASGYEAHIGVPVERASQLEVGSEHPLKLGDQRFSATLRAIRADVDPATLTVGAIFDLPEDIGAHEGETVLMTLDESINISGGWLPVSALLEGDRGLWNVLVVSTSEGGTVTAREAVEVIYSRGKQVFVRGTLADGAQVVATGVHRLSPGMPVEPIAAGAN